MTAKKKLKPKDLISGRHYFLCCPQNKHMDIVLFQVRGPQQTRVIWNIGDECEQLASDFEEAFFIEVKRPEGMEAWTL